MTVAGTFVELAVVATNQGALVRLLTAPLLPAAPPPAAVVEESVVESR